MFIFPLHVSPKAYPPSHSLGIWYYFSERRGGAKRPGREAGLWVTPTKTIHRTVQPSHIFLPQAFDRAVTTLPFQTMCYSAHMDSITTQQLIPYTISLGHSQVKVTKVHCKTRYNMTCTAISLWFTLMKAFILLDEGACKQQWTWKPSWYYTGFGQFTNDRDPSTPGWEQGLTTPTTYKKVSCSEFSDNVSQKGGTQWRWSRPQSGYGIWGSGEEAEMKRKRTKKRGRIIREWFYVEKYYINL